MCGWDLSGWVLAGCVDSGCDDSVYPYTDTPNLFLSALLELSTHLGNMFHLTILSTFLLFVFPIKSPRSSALNEITIWQNALLAEIRSQREAPSSLLLD